MPAVEPQRGLVELVVVEINIRDAAVAGPAVGFGHQARGDAGSLMGLSNDELLNQGVALRRQRRNIGRFKPFMDLDPNQPHDSAIDFSQEQRLIGIVQMRVKQALRPGRLVGGAKSVREFLRMERIGLSTQSAGRAVVGSFSQSNPAAHGTPRIRRRVLAGSLAMLFSAGAADRRTLARCVGSKRVSRNPDAPVLRPGDGHATYTREEATKNRHLNDYAGSASDPANVWTYRQGGCNALTKWLLVREQKVLERALRPEKVQHFSETARRIRAIRDATATPESLT